LYLGQIGTEGPENLAVSNFRLEDEGSRLSLNYTVLHVTLTPPAGITSNATNTKKKSHIHEP
jgi:hypothetical protein